MTNIKSRADQFSLIIHGQEGEGEEKEGFLKEEGAQLCGTHPVCPSLMLGFPELQMVLHGASSEKKSDPRISCASRSSLTLRF